MLLLALKNNGGCPCPRCLVKKDNIDRLGTVSDRNARIKLARVDNNVVAHSVKTARQYLFEGGRATTSAYVLDPLASRSLLPRPVRPPIDDLEVLCPHLTTERLHR